MAIVTYQQLRDRRPPPTESGSTCLRWLVEDMMTTLIVPDYQRGHVWTPGQSSAFLGHWLEGGYVGPIYTQRWRDPFRSDELVDGLQRVTAWTGFYRNEIPAQLHDGLRFYLEQMDPEDQRRVASHSGCVINLAHLKLGSRAEVLRFYLRMNRGAVIHAPEELNRVEGLLALEEGQ